ncbi:MAG TPA: acetyl-CoA hydrolase/transferase C-terminal domain-containing protein [Dehalococcoidia bacterium]|nr:acetyl-CoA hydrolase/transferase C-terminal domain-containing protein [Dehalococcoidia bacterium]
MSTFGSHSEAQRKTMSPEEAAGLIESGQRVYLQGGSAVPFALVDALVARYRELENVEIVHLHTEGPAPYVQPEMEGHFRHNALFIGKNVREAVNAGRADFTPVFLSNVPRLFETTLPLDVALIQVSPPDRFGFCSLGISVDCAKPAALAARKVIAQVNSRMPRTHGDSFLHVSQIDHLVPCDCELIEVDEVAADDPVSREIGRLVASLVEDGSTIQTGIGSIPNAVLDALRSRRHLGLHTEMFSDGVLRLMEEGVIDNDAKTYHRGKAVASFVIGSRRLYDFVDDNPMIEMHPVTFTNDPFHIAQNNKMVAINSAIEIDLTGQVCADSIGHRLYSGTGGQLDFVRGALRSPGGKAIIALPSTAASGSVSRIVPELKPGAGVVTTRGDVQFVVTEYGIADLFGRSLRERARALIDIAHPRFRPQLEDEAGRLGLLR